MDQSDREGKKAAGPHSIYNGPYFRVRQKFDPYDRIRARNFNSSWRNEGILEQTVAEWMGLA